MNIIVDLDYQIQDGSEVVFRSPVDCSQVTGLLVNHTGGSKEFMFADAHGENVGDIDHLFAENAVVKVILDLESSPSMAFVQNADTNAYLEGRFDDLEEQLLDSLADLAENVISDKLTLRRSNPHALVSMYIPAGGTNAIAFRDYNTGKEVVLSGIGDGVADTDVVNKRQLDSSLAIAVDSAVKETIDKTCPAINDSGAIVVCEPVEGYPLTVVTADEATKVTRCGKNLLNTALGNLKKVSWFRPSSGTYSPTYWGVELLLPPGSYVMKAKPNGTTKMGYLYGLITDIDGNAIAGEYHAVYGGTMVERPTTQADWFKVIIYEASASIESGNTALDSASAWFNRFDIQIETGTKATAFEPYCGETFAVGDTIPALDGINTIYADAGEVTVTGRTNPVTIIEKLTNAIISLGGNV